MIRKARVFPVGVLVAAAGALIALRLAAEPLTGAEPRPPADAHPASLSLGSALSTWTVPTDLLSAARRAALGSVPAGPTMPAHSAVAGASATPATQLSATALHRRVLAYQSGTVGPADFGLAGELHQPVLHCRAVSYRNGPIDHPQPRPNTSPNADAPDEGPHLGTTLHRFSNRSAT